MKFKKKNMYYTIKAFNMGLQGNIHQDFVKFFQQTFNKISIFWYVTEDRSKFIEHDK